MKHKADNRQPILPVAVNEGIPACTFALSSRLQLGLLALTINLA